MGGENAQLAGGHVHEQGKHVTEFFPPLTRVFLSRLWEEVLVPAVWKEGNKGRKLQKKKDLGGQRKVLKRDAA